MSLENVEWIRRFFELYNGREIDSWVGMLARDVEWHVDPVDPDTTVHRGPEAVKRHALSWAETVDATFGVREVQETQDKREALEAVGLRE